MNTKKLQSTNSHAKIPLICNTDTVQALILNNSARIVDVRKSEEYLQSHIRSAASLPLSQILEKEPSGIIEILKNLGVTDTLPVVIYDDTFGALAARVAWTLQYVGHSNTSLLEVTYSQWKRMGLETESNNNKFPKVEHAMRINHKIQADASYVDLAKEQENKFLVDSRERLNFLTEHIPNAKNIPYTMLRSDNNILRKPEEIRRLIENRGMSTDSEFITYCGSAGTLSGLAFFALKSAGIKNVKLYSKSFREWKLLGKVKEEFKDANYWDLSAD
ncbi:MAG TPA: rhodanese-like domain-containing protein [Nitrososphaeraceae archaeon]|jgi:thiosulfate/3-mercaptopyruvate sulfurtransferase